MSNNGGAYSWSTVANNNANADSTINFSAGMAPSSVSPSCRSLMASVAKYRDDISGMLVTGSGGTSTGYIVSSNQDFDSAADMHLKTIAFTPNITNVAGSPSVTLTVDGFEGPLRTAPNVELQAGTIIAGTPYVALYNNTDKAFYLQGFFGQSPSAVPLGGTVIWWDDTLPNSSWAWANGQTVAVATVSSVLLARWGNKFGGDGVTTMGLPDLRSTAPMGRPTMGGVATRGLGITDQNTNTLIGEAAHTLAASEIPTIDSINNGSPGYNLQNGTTSGLFSTGATVATINTVAANTSSGASSPLPVSGIVIIGTGTLTSVSNNTGGQPHNNVQPSTVCNFIVRIQ